MIFLRFSPYFIFSSFLTTLLLDRGVRVTGNKQVPPSSPWVPSATPTAKTPKNESETLKKVLPLVTFDCRGKTGYFTDSKFNCEVFHHCQPDGARNTFHCPAHQLFNQLSMVCEQKTTHNSKLCKEGSISPTKLQKTQTRKKINSEKLNPVLKPFLNSSSSNNTKKIMTLEDLLSYMNREQAGKESEPTFISRFHNAQENQKAKILPESAITTPRTDGKSAKDKKPSKSMDVHLKPEGSDQILRIVKSSSKSEDIPKKNEGEEAVSAEYDAIEGRKNRKHKRVGRVLDVERDNEPKREKEKKGFKIETEAFGLYTGQRNPKPHAHMTERSVSDPSHQEITTPPATGDTVSRDNNPPSLFSTDRNKARDVRKKKRYQGRKRKMTTTPGTNGESDTESDVAITTAMPTIPPEKQNSDNARNNAHRRRKNQRTRPRDESYKAPKPEKVEPYTLPPLPTPITEKIETTTHSMPREESKRSKNPWYKTTLPPPDEEAKFGTKLTEADEHQHSGVVDNSPPKRDFYENKDVPYTSEELLSEEYRERLTMQSNQPGDSRHSDKSSAKHSKKHNDDDNGYKYASHFDTYHTTAPENLFPPPRAEPREHHSTPPQQMMFDYGSSHHKSKSQSYSKATTEDPFQVTHSYLDKYQAEVKQEFKDFDKHRWKTDSEKVKTDEKKVEVGSTFSFQDPIIPETTKKPRLKASPTTESPITLNINKEKDITKHTLAHQHLSKIMNDFFAMSSSNIPGRLNLDTDNDEHTMVPDYRIPDEDIYTGLESVVEDVGEIPKELLDVVDLITSNSGNEKNNMKPRTSHEVIKINGPITDSHLEKIFFDEKFDRDFEQQPSTDGSFKKIVVIPQPEDFKENRDADEEDEIRSLKFESLLKQLSDDKATEEEITSIRLESFLKQLSREKSHPDEETTSLKLGSLLKQLTSETSRPEEENIPLRLASILRELTEEKAPTEEEIESLKLESILRQISDGKSFRDEQVTSLDKLEPFLKQLLNKKSLTVIPLQQERETKPQQSVLSAKKVPVRVIYRDQLAETIKPKPSTRKPTAKLMQAHRPSPRVKVFTNEKRHTKPMMHPLSTNSRPQIILHPPTLYPPHPPPLPTKQYPFRVGYPFITHPMSHLRNIRPVHSRKKRSVMSRLRRQIQHNQHFLPFSSPVYPSFNPKFVPTFSPFKALFSPSSMNSAGSHLAPFSFPGFPFPKPSQNRPHIFRPSHPRPPPVRHISPTGHQTVIVEEVPVPIHVEVPSPNLMHSSPSGPHSSKIPPRFPENQFRNPSPPAVQNQQFVQRPQNRFPQPPSDFRPMSMPSNSRPPASINPPPYRSPIPMTGPLPPRITSQGQMYALGVTNKPILPPPNAHSVRSPNGNPKPPRNLPSPYGPFNVHANSYPNFPYFQGAFTTPISDEPIIGRVMYSGYKPPRSTLGTKPPKSTAKDKDRKTSESNANRSSSKPTEEYFQALSKPMRESHVSYTEEVMSRGRPRAQPHIEDHSPYHTTAKYPGQSLSHLPVSDEIPRKRKPGRRRRPRPYSTTQGSPILNEISPTPPPPEQIPPPPADYTSKPSNHEAFSSLPNFSENSKTHETSSHFPPAGYYGKDQLVQFFDSSSKPQQASNIQNPYHKKLSEGRSSIEKHDPVTSSSVEDGDEPVFGMRIRSKSATNSRSGESKPKQHPRSQTQKNEIRTRPYNRPQQATEENKKEITRPLEDNKPPTQIRNEKEHTQVRNENPTMKKRRPPSRPRGRRPPPRPQPEVHHFNYNGNMENFYSVPRGLHTVIKPSDHPQQGFRGTTDMFGISHPAIDQSIYSLRPQGAPDFDPNFFSVPAHISQQQQSPLHKMNIKPIPESAREFFTSPDINASTPENSESDKKESESRNLPSKSKEENKVQREHPVRKLRKPKRKNRYNPHSNEQKDTSEINNIKPQTEPETQSTVRYREKTTTDATTTTTEPRFTTTLHHQANNDIKEPAVVFKQRSPLLPKTLPELSKSLMDGKIDIQKLNATISTSVSVSGAVPQDNDTSSEEKENKRVFSSQNGGGLAVVRKGTKRKRPRQRVSTSTGVPYVNSDSDNDAKYEIAASVLDIIKATTETERQASEHRDSTKNEKPSSSRVTNTWVESPLNKRQNT